MKYILYLSFVTFLFLAQISIANATTATPSAKPSPKDSSVGEQINDLKDRIASRVAQLKLVEKRGVIGTVTSVSDTQITITDLEDTKRFIDVDELTKFSSPSAKDSFGISDITKGTQLGVLGLYNKQSKRILARFVNVVSIPIFISGTVADKDDEEFNVTIKQTNGPTLTVDIEKTTKTFLYIDEELVRSGFSKIEQGQRVVAIGYPDDTEKNKMSALRVLLFPPFPAGANQQTEEKPTPTVKASSSSTNSNIQSEKKTGTNN